MIRRLLVRSPNWLGDAVLSLPAVADICRHFSTAEVAVAALDAVAPLFEVVPGVSRTIALRRSPGQAWWRHAADVRTLRAAQADLAILLPNSFSAAWDVYRAGIGERWGYRADGRGLLLTRAVPRPRQERHQTEYYQSLLQALGLETSTSGPRLDVPDADRAEAGTMLQREGCGPDAVLVGMAPGAAYGHAKRWPPPRMAELAARLWRERQARPVVVGSAADRPAVADMIDALSGTGVPIVSLAGRTSLRQLMGVMACCRAFVSNDSGAMHLAAAVGLPVTGIFGPTNDRVTAPLRRSDARGDHAILTNPVWCRPCMLRECPIDHRCMTGIPASRVFDEVSRQLAAASRAL